MSTALAQVSTTTIYFVTDDSGNRIQRSNAPVMLQESNAPMDLQKAITLAEQSSSLPEELPTETIVKLFPNPVQDWLQVRTDHVLPGAVIQLYDLSGRQLRQQAHAGSDSELNLADLPAGTYVLLLRSQDFTSTWKVVKR
jgi:hypothetical protein